MYRTKSTEHMYLALEKIIGQKIQPDHQLTEVDNQRISEYIDNIAITKDEAEKSKEIDMISFISQVFRSNDHQEKIESILEQWFIHPCLTKIQHTDVNLSFITDLLVSISKGTLEPKPTKKQLFQIFTAILRKNDNIDPKIITRVRRLQLTLNAKYDYSTVSVGREPENKGMYEELEKIISSEAGTWGDDRVTELGNHLISKYIDSIATTKDEDEKNKKIEMIKFIKHAYPSSSQIQKIESILQELVIHPSVTQIQHPDVKLSFIMDLLASISNKTLEPEPTEHQLAQIFNAILTQQNLITDSKIYEQLYALVFLEKGLINNGDDIKYLTPIQNQLLNQLLKQLPEPQLNQFIQRYTATNDSEMVLFFLKSDGIKNDNLTSEMLKNILEKQPQRDDQKIDDKKKVNEIIQAIFSLKDQCDKTIFQELRFHVPILTTETLGKVITVIEEKSPRMTNDELMFSVDLCTKILSQKSTTPAMIERIVDLASTMKTPPVALYYELTQNAETLSALKPNSLITIKTNLINFNQKSTHIDAILDKIEQPISRFNEQIEAQRSIASTDLMTTMLLSRPSYEDIKQYLDRKGDNKPTQKGVSSTLTSYMRKDISHDLNMINAFLGMTGDNKPNQDAVSGALLEAVKKVIPKWLPLGVDRYPNFEDMNAFLGMAGDNKPRQDAVSQALTEIVSEHLSKSSPLYQIPSSLRQINVFLAMEGDNKPNQSAVSNALNKIMNNVHRPKFDTINAFLRMTGDNKPTQEAVTNALKKVGFNDGSLPNFDTINAFLVMKGGNKPTHQAFIEVLEEMTKSPANTHAIKEYLKLEDNPTPEDALKALTERAEKAEMSSNQDTSKSLVNFKSEIEKIRGSNLPPDVPPTPNMH